MSIRRTGAAVPAAGIAVVLLLLLVGGPAWAALHEVSVGNYYFEQDSTRRRDRVEVSQGDQIRFTVREAAYPPHNLNVDELNIHSPDLQVFDTYTTPPIEKVGTYTLYCRPHRDRGHVTTLVVRPRPAATTSTAPAPTTASTTAGRTTTSTTSRTTTTSVATSSNSTSTAPAAVGGPTTIATLPHTDPEPGDGSTGGTDTTLAPVGVGTATDRRVPEADPDSLAGLIGRRPSQGGPWTRAVRLSVLSLLPLGGVAWWALRRDRRRELGPP